MSVAVIFTADLIAAGVPEMMWTGQGCVLTQARRGGSAFFWEVAAVLDLIELPHLRWTRSVTTRVNSITPLLTTIVSGIRVHSERAKVCVWSDSISAVRYWGSVGL